MKYIGHRVAALEAGENVPEAGLEAIHRILKLVRAQTGNDFSSYKKKTILRRVERRAGILDLQDLSAYIGYLRTNPDEVELLQKDLLISVTRFFRDPDAFAALKERILIDLVAERTELSALRIWVPACATGEEVYSIAILLQECMDETHRKLDVQIFGTDIDVQAVERARTGLYPDSIVADVGAERLSKFFVFENERYRVKKSLREMVVFAIHNLLNDPPFSRIDLISCRNLLIYLEPKAQQRVASTFAYAANPGALLFLGGSESLNPFSEFFKPVDDKARIAERMKYPMPAVTSAAASPRIPGEAVSGRSRIALNEMTGPDWRGVVPEVERFLLDQLAPPTVIINASGEVVYIHGDTGKYLRPATGQATNNVSSMARKGIKSYLSSGILRASKEGKEVVVKNIKVDVYGHPEAVDLRVMPILGREETEGLLAVVFEESHPVRSGKRTSQDHVVQECKEFKERLDEAEKQLTATTTELEASREEIRSLTEEMESTNEEFQSTNEELETSREELQSVNEELLTVNNELQQRIEKQAGVTNDLKNLLNNTEIAIIFLDTKLKLRRFTEPATRFVNLVQTDLGRPLTAFSTDLLEVDLTAKAKAVINTLKAEEQEVRTKNGEWYLMRLLPYRTEGNAPDGVVVTFVDINSRKRAEKEVVDAVEEAKKKAQRLEAILRSMNAGLIELDQNGRVIYANPTALKQLDVRRVEDYAQALDIRTEDGKPIPPEEWPFQKAIKGETFFNQDFQVRNKGTNHTFIGSFSGNSVVDQEGKFTSAIVTIGEISRPKAGPASAGEAANE